MNIKKKIQGAKNWCKEHPKTTLAIKIIAGSAVIGAAGYGMAKVIPNVKKTMGSFKEAVTVTNCIPEYFGDIPIDFTDGGKNWSYIQTERGAVRIKDLGKFGVNIRENIFGGLPISEDTPCTVMLQWDVD